MVNVIVDEVVWARHRRVARQAGGLVIRGMLERTDDVINVLAERITRLDLGMHTEVARLPLVASRVVSAPIDAATLHAALDDRWSRSPSSKKPVDQRRPDR